MKMGDVYRPKDQGTHLVIVPNSLRDAINTRLDAEEAKDPGVAGDREHLYSLMLSLFEEYGYIPEFTLEKRGIGCLPDC
jgi:hypothetical protein